MLFVVNRVCEAFGHRDSIAGMPLADFHRRILHCKIVQVTRSLCRKLDLLEYLSCIRILWIYLSSKRHTQLQRCLTSWSRRSHVYACRCGGEAALEREGEVCSRYEL